MVILNNEDFTQETWSSQWIAWWNLDKPWISSRDGYQNPKTPKIHGPTAVPGNGKRRKVSGSSAWTATFRGKLSHKTVESYPTNSLTRCFKYQKTNTRDWRLLWFLQVLERKSWGMVHKMARCWAVKQQTELELRPMGTAIGYSHKAVISSHCKHNWLS